jgi:protein-S-isoprenylcysteine O-methyltransferase Ste14
MTAVSRNQPLSEDTRIGVRRWMRKQIGFLFMLVLFLFLPAGRLDWTMGWVHVAIYVLFFVMQVVAVAPRSPGLLAERSKMQRGTKSWDKVIALLAAAILPIVVWIVAGFDFRNGWTSVPMVAQIVAIPVILLGFAITVWAMASNPFFSATVRLQSERGHQVAREGAYRIVRHPGYVGALIFNLATPIQLGSLWALVPAVLIAILYLIRTRLEDRMLQEELPGYREYAQEVRSKLIPGLW